MSEHGDWMIRVARPEDAMPIALVHVRSWQETYPGQVPDFYLHGLDRDIERRKEVWHQLIKANPESSAVLAAEIDAEIVGFISVGPARDEGLNAQNVGELGVIYLRQKYWGAGIGKALHDSGLNKLRSAGFTEAILWVLDTNTRTRRWYERQGWRTDGATKVDDRGDFVLNEVRYRLDLRNSH